MMSAGAAAGRPALLRVGTAWILVDDEDLPLLQKFDWYLDRNHSGNLYPKAWVESNGKRTSIRMHRLVMGVLDQPNVIIDHRRGNTLDCRKKSLRRATIKENARNQKMRRNNTSGYKGVTWNPRIKRWESWIAADKKRTYLGSHKCPTKAWLAYVNAAKQIHGEFARFH